MTPREHAEFGLKAARDYWVLVERIAPGVRRRYPVRPVRRSVESRQVTIVDVRLGLFLSMVPLVSDDAEGIAS
jgi:hypothetical protein